LDTSYPGPQPHLHLALYEMQVHNLPPLDDALMEAYNNHIDGPLPVFAEAVVVAATEADALELAKAYVGDRAGYANNAQIPTAEGTINTQRCSCH
jgi:hypothetical protein